MKNKSNLTINTGIDDSSCINQLPSQSVKAYNLKKETASPSSCRHLEEMTHLCLYHIDPVVGYVTTYEADYTWKKYDGHDIYCKSPIAKKSPTRASWVSPIFGRGVAWASTTEYHDKFSPKATKKAG